MPKGVCMPASTATGGSRGSSATAARRRSWTASRGKRLNSPNDLAFHSNGNLYFTDPAYGLHHRYEDPDRELPFCGVYLARPGEREPVLLTDELRNPNGLAFTPDEKHLYVTQSNPERAVVMKYPVNGDGTLGAGKVFQDLTAYAPEMPGLPDGMKVDRRGNVFSHRSGRRLGFRPQRRSARPDRNRRADRQPVLGQRGLDALPVLPRPAVPPAHAHRRADTGCGAVARFNGPKPPVLPQRPR